MPPYAAWTFSRLLRFWHIIHGGVGAETTNAKPSKFQRKPTNCCQNHATVQQKPKKTKIQRELRMGREIAPFPLNLCFFFCFFCTIAWFWQQLVGFLWISLGFSLVPGSMNYLCFSLSRLERRRERTVRERMNQTGSVQHSDLKLSVCRNTMLHSSCLGQPLSFFLFLLSPYL